MFLPEEIYLVAMEEYKERLRGIEQQQLRHQAGSAPGVAQRKVAHWLGSQMVRWGTKLQNL